MGRGLNDRDRLPDEAGGGAEGGGDVEACCCCGDSGSGRVALMLLRRG